MGHSPHAFQAALSAQSAHEYRSHPDADHCRLAA
jgi:hypothetical protein